MVRDAVEALATSFFGRLGGDVGCCCCSVVDERDCSEFALCKSPAISTPSVLAARAQPAAPKVYRDALSRPVVDSHAPCRPRVPGGC